MNYSIKKDDYEKTIRAFRAGKMLVKDFVKILENNSDFSTYYKKRIEREVSGDFPINAFIEGRDTL